MVGHIEQQQHLLKQEFNQMKMHYQMFNQGSHSSRKNKLDEIEEIKGEQQSEDEVSQQ